MRKVQRTALVPHSAEQMFRLVDDVEAYPRFLPWCSDARIKRREGDVVEASLELHKGGLSKHFTTRNTRIVPESIELELLDGPFSHLEGGWQFQDLAGQGCKVTLALSFEFDSMLLDMLMGSFFEETCNKLVDAFTQRAAIVYAED